MRREWSGHSLDTPLDKALVACTTPRYTRPLPPRLVAGSSVETALVRGHSRKHEAMRERVSELS
eukprot:scaffold57610_cov34-Tisochrysis_lutea.AAC.2